MSPKAVRFKIWYEDGTTRLGTEEIIPDIPQLGIAVIVQEDQYHNRRIFGGYDFYIWNPKRQTWLGGDKWSKQYYEERYGWLWLAGVMMHLEDYSDIFRLADNDPEFPERTARYANESELPTIPEE